MLENDDKSVREANKKTILGLMTKIPKYIVGSVDKTSSENLIWMMERCLREIETFPLDKLNRWIGFVQGVLAMSGHLDVDEERNRTRTFYHEAYKNTGQTIPETMERNLPTDDSWSNNCQIS